MSDLRTIAREDLPGLVCLVPQDISVAETVRENFAHATPEAASEDRSRPGWNRAAPPTSYANCPTGSTPSWPTTAAALPAENVNEEAGQSSFEDTDRTTVIITHRLITLLRAERIVVLDQGRVVGDGTHQDLLATCEACRRLVLPQMDLDTDRHPTEQP